MSQIDVAAAAPSWRWLFYVLVPVWFVLETMINFEMVMVGAFAGWSGRNTARTLYNLTVVAPWIASIVLGVRAIAAAHAGNLRSSTLRSAGFVISSLTGLGIAATGVFE